MLTSAVPAYGAAVIVDVAVAERVAALVFREAVVPLGSGVGVAGADRLDQGAHQLVSLAAVLVSVGGAHFPVDAPGRFDLGVSVCREQGGEALGLFVGEEVNAGVEGPPRPGLDRYARTNAPTTL